ncbi:MAG TPA: BMP family ABC transporter substrate-binding protein [Thermoanaerobaculia bacterium]
MRRSLIAALAGALIFGACAPRDPAPPPPARRDRFAAALLTSGSIADDGWDAAAYDGLRGIQAGLGAPVAHREASTPAARHEAMRLLARGGVDVLFAQGDEFQDAALAAGPLFPRTVFVVAEGDIRARNLVPLVFRVEEAAWLLGMAAGAQSTSGRAGAVAVRSRASARALAAFRGGAQSVRPGFVLDEAWIADADDGEAARSAAIAMIDAGADVLFQMAGAASRTVVAACTERGVLCFAAPRPMNDRAPEAVLASAVVDVPAAMAEIATLVNGRRFRSGVFSYGMKEGIVAIAWNETLRRRIAPEAMKRIDETQAAILEGRFRPLLVDR